MSSNIEENQNSLPIFKGYETINEILFNCCTNLVEPNWKNYDALEIHPMKINDYGNYEHLDEATEDQAEFWSIFGHIPEEGLDDITDIPNKEDAHKVFKYFLTKLQN